MYTALCALALLLGHQEGIWTVKNLALAIQDVFPRKPLGNGKRGWLNRSKGQS